MLRGYRRYIIAAFAGLAGLAIIISAALYSYGEFYEPAEQDQAAQSYQPARNATRPLAPRGQHPPTQAYDPHCEQPQSHEDADLCAQWGAVRAVAETNRLTRVALKLGYIGFWVAFIGGLFGIVGTALIFLAWKETRAANQIAHDALDGQLRPWIYFVTARWGTMEIVDDNLELTAKVTFENIGASPAIDLTYMGTMIFGDDLDPQFRKLVEDFRAGSHDWADKNLFPGKEWERNACAVHTGNRDIKTKVTFVIIARYLTPFSDQYRFTARAYEVHTVRRDEGHSQQGAWEIDLNNPPPSGQSKGPNVSLVEKQHFSGYAT